MSTPGLGLTSAEAQRRLEASPHPAPHRGSRSYRDIVWSNTFTVFNLILGTLLVIVLVFGDLRDALFGGVIVANTAIGIIQEVRAKRTLDRLSLLAAPRPAPGGTGRSPSCRSTRWSPATRCASSRATRWSPTGA